MPDGRALALRGQDWDPQLLRYETSFTTFFPSEMPSGTYVASMPGPDGLPRTVQDTIQTQPLELPTLLSPVYGEFVDCQPVLRWAAVPRATHYQVLMRTRFGQTTVISNTVNTTEYPVAAGVLKYDTVYEWKVFAFDQGVGGDVDNQSKCRFSRLIVGRPCS